MRILHSSLSKNSQEIVFRNYKIVDIPLFEPSLSIQLDIVYVNNIITEYTEVETVVACEKKIHNCGMYESETLTTEKHGTSRMETFESRLSRVLL